MYARRRSDKGIIIIDAHLRGIYIIGASLSEPHTRGFGGEISVCMLVCLRVCLYLSDFMRELQVKMFTCSWQIQVNKPQL